jgi:PKHD-type hydroxylase
MILKHNYWFFKKALSNDFCKKIISFGKKQQLSPGKIVAKLKKQELKNKTSKDNFNDLNNIRDSNVSFLNHTWIYDTILPFVHTANKNAGWNFEIDWCEAAQFTVYGKNQHYGWHVDSTDEPYNRPDNEMMHGKIRKLSVVCSLTDPKKYKGGELQFDFSNSCTREPNIISCKEIKEKGSLAVFPSEMWHRVTPVEKGIRYSLVLWLIGKPFK